MQAEKKPRAVRITNVDELKDRCIIDDFTGCWHWQGAMNTDRNGVRTPQMHVFDSTRGYCRTVTGPLAVLEVAGRRGIGVRMGWRTCRCDDCVNPEHIMGGTRKDWGRWIASHGLWKNVAARVVATRESARARSPVTPEIVAEIRSSPLTGRELSKKLGLKVRHISHIRTKSTWKDSVVPGASVFTLGAR